MGHLSPLVNGSYDAFTFLLNFRLVLYISLLVGAKFLRSVGLFLAYDILKLVPVVLFLFIIKAG